MSRFEHIGRASERVCGTPNSELAADANKWKALIHTDDVSRVEKAILQQSRGRRVTVDFRIVRPDGTVRWLHSRSAPMRGHPSRRLALGITSDITDRVLRQREEREKAYQQRDALVREVHHRIKNSLQGLVGLLERSASGATNNSKWLDGAVSQIKAIAAVHGVHAVRSDGSLTVHEIVAEIAGTMRAMAAVPISITEWPPELRMLRICDGEGSIFALILNELVMNAVKHADRDATVKEVTVSTYESDREVGVVIRNPGQLPEGFDFTSSARPGTGLGLVRALLPPKGLQVDLLEIRGIVETHLVIAAPIVSVSDWRDQGCTAQ